MKRYLVQFVVQAESATDALDQAEQYLNTENRTIDCRVMGPTGPLGQISAPRLGGEHVNPPHHRR